MGKKSQRPLLPRNEFFVRVAQSSLAAFVLIAVSLAIGMGGYHHFEKMPWIDAFVNAAMILSGMGPVTELHTSGGKLFAGCYALYSGLALITIAAVLLAPVVHRFLHRFHIEIGSGDGES
jgi:hypothetical protein